MIRTVLIVILLAGCAGSGATPEPTDEPEQTDEPGPTPAPDLYTDAEAAAVYAEGLFLVLAEDPAYVPAWWPLLQTDENGIPRVEVEDDWAYLQTNLSAGDEALALEICNVVKTLVYDDDSQPLGITDVLIFGGAEALADCDVPVLNP